jgi:hypothetical protein
MEFGACCQSFLKGCSMTKLLKHSVLALALALGTSTYAHAESVALVHGGFAAVIQEIIDWLFGHSDHHNSNPGNSTPTNNVAPEVDPSLALSGFILLGGTLTVVRSRRRS